MSRDEKDEDMIYGLTVDERDALRTGLLGLPETMPPRAVWHRIREQAEAEGLISHPRSRRPSTWYMGGGLAAAAMLVIVILPGRVETPGVGTDAPGFASVPPPVVEIYQPEVNALQALMVESRQLETDLRSSGLTFYYGEGIAADGSHREASVLVIGLSKEAAIQVGRKWDQSAIVYGQRGEAAQLLYCN